VIDGVREGSGNAKRRAEDKLFSEAGNGTRGAKVTRIKLRPDKQKKGTAHERHPIPPATGGNQCEGR